uniref:BOD1/SHG1 domain-containing protein n=1 Tax=Sinocyclocheilus anshuiensis TaxID=1608454 RepID=A0A671TC61_9TELE
MAALHPGDPQLVSMIVSHLKTEGLFDQFRRDCLADVDTKPAYFPQLNKNQLRNSIRQLVLQSGMLEQGVDRIVAQVVDPKVHHSFRPQVERVVQKFLSPNAVRCNCLTLGYLQKKFVSVLFIFSSSALLFLAVVSGKQ